MRFLRLAAHTLLFVSVCFSVFLSCTSALLKESDVKKLNQIYSARVFRAKKNLFATFSDPNSGSRKVLFRKGQKVRIWIESNGDWIKVRAISAKESLEHNPGVTIIYILREILEDAGEDEDVIESYPPERLQKEIEEILQPI